MSFLKKSEGIELTNKRVSFWATNTTYTSTNPQTIRIDIQGGDEHIDFENSYLVFDMAATTTGTQVGLKRYAASSWMREIRFKDRAGNQLGENVQKYAEKVRSLYELQASTDQEASYLDVLEGATGVALTSAVSSRQYAHRFVTHVGGMKNYFPVKYLGVMYVLLLVW